MKAKDFGPEVEHHRGNKMSSPAELQPIRKYRTTLNVGWSTRPGLEQPRPDSSTFAPRTDQRKKNQDKVVVIDDLLPMREEKCLFFGVIDGHGSRDQAEMVTDCLLQYLPERMLARALDSKNVHIFDKALRRMFPDTDEEIYRRFGDKLYRDLQGGGGAVGTFGMIYRDHLVLDHLGDCAAVACVWDGKKRKAVVERLTRAEEDKSSSTDAQLRAKFLQNSAVTDGRLLGYQCSRGWGDFAGKAFRPGDAGKSHTIENKPPADSKAKVCSLSQLFFIIVASDGFWNYFPQYEEAVEKVWEALPRDGTLPSATKIAGMLTEMALRRNEKEQQDRRAAGGPEPAPGSQVRDDCTVLVILLGNSMKNAPPPPLPDSGRGQQQSEKSMDEKKPAAQKLMKAPLWIKPSRAWNIGQTGKMPAEAPPGTSRVSATPYWEWEVTVYGYSRTTKALIYITRQQSASARVRRVGEPTTMSRRHRRCRRPQARPSPPYPR